MILLTGASGQLGTAFRRYLPDLHTPTRSTMDLRHPTTAVTYARSVKPDAIVNCAAYTAVDAAEEHLDTARSVNATSVGLLSEFAHEAGIPFVTFSTDYVFDGSAGTPYVESSPTNPINAYGRSKEAGEQLALKANPSALVIRTSWVISATHRNFVTAILARTRESGAEVVTDQEGCPTYADDLALGTIRALDAGVSGVLHLTNRGSTTWFELARAACSEVGIDPDRIRPTTSDAIPRTARRPGYSVLDSERLAPLGLDPLPTWRDALRRLCRDLDTPD